MLNGLPSMRFCDSHFRISIIVIIVFLFDLAFKFSHGRDLSNVAFKVVISSGHLQIWNAASWRSGMNMFSRCVFFSASRYHLHHLLGISSRWSGCIFVNILCDLNEWLSLSPSKKHQWWLMAPKNLLELLPKIFVIDFINSTFG